MPDIFVYFNEADDSISYHLKQNGSVRKGIIAPSHNNIDSVAIKMSNFYSSNSVDFNGSYTITPKYNSESYNKLIEELKPENIMANRAKSPDDYAIIINYSREEGQYIITCPKVIKGEITNLIAADIYSAYDWASNMRSTIYENHPYLATAVSIWPRRSSLAWLLLAEGKNVDHILTGEGKRSFSSVVESMLDAVRKADVTKDYTISDVENLIYESYSYLDVFLAQDKLNERITQFVKSKTGIELVGSSHKARKEMLYHPAWVMKVYKGKYKDEGYQYVPLKYSADFKFCEDTKEAFFTKNLAEIKNKRYRGLICWDSAERMGFYKCGICSAVHHEDDACPEYTKMPKEHIYNYSIDVRTYIHKMYKTDIDKPVNGAMTYYGLELEVMPKDGVTKNIAAFNCGSAIFNHALLKSDSSLINPITNETGFEIVTVPATLEYHRTKLWHNFFNTPYASGLTAAKSVRSWDSMCCGIHVHITRAALTDMQLSKMLVFYHEPKSGKFLSRIAGRPVGPDAVYCKAAKKKLGILTKEQCSSHHDAITVSKRNKGKTVEVRIFRGNATFHGIIRAIEFVDAVAKWCGQNSGDDATDYTKFLDWFNQPRIKSQYPDLRKHLIDLKYLKKKETLKEEFQHLEEIKEELKTA